MNEQYSGSSSPSVTPTTSNTEWSLQERNGFGLAATASAPATVYQQNANAAREPTNVINLSNSTDVVIGQMTQYQGPVVIYQMLDATVESRSMHANGEIDQSRTTTNTTTSFIQNLTSTAKVIILLTLLVIIVVGIVLIIELSKDTPVEIENGAILFGNNYVPGTFPNLGNGHLVVDRDQWGASNIGKLTVALNHPISYVIIIHIGVRSIPCTNIRKCSTKMRTSQDSAIAEKNLGDIRGNFYIADDGNIYVGRGWNFANPYINNTLSITFMGDYDLYEPSAALLEATQYLFAYALTENYLKSDFRIVALNHTEITKSPGANVYARIKNWPRFYNCGRNRPQECDFKNL